MRALSRPMHGLAVALLLLAAQASAQQRLADQLKVERGIERFLHLNVPITRLSMGDPKLVDVSVLDGSTLRILGMAPGETTFSIWRTGSTQPETYGIVVTENMSSLSEKIASTGNANTAHVTDVAGKVVIEGQFGDEAARNEVRSFAKFVTGKDVLDLSDVSAHESVQVEVEIVAVSRTALRGLGINFSRLDRGFSIVSAAPNTLQPFALNPNSATGIDATTVAPIASAFNLLLASPQYNALFMISALEGSNYARTLAQPTLVVRSGEKAEFLVGGEIPIPVPQGGTTNTVTIQYKRFGVSLNVEPTILKDRRIALKIKPEVSELDFSNAIAIQGFSIPAIRTRETETTVEVKENEPLILAGLMYDDGNSVKEKLPFLGDLPILGEFFKRTNETHDEQELIVAVTPRLVTSATQNRAQQQRVESDAHSVKLPGDAGTKQ
jgi:pilus assembly protein CpaC